VWPAVIVATQAGSGQGSRSLRTAGKVFSRNCREICDGRKFDSLCSAKTGFDATSPLLSVPAEGRVTTPHLQFAPAAVNRPVCARIAQFTG